MYFYQLNHAVRRDETHRSQSMSNITPPSVANGLHCHASITWLSRLLQAKPTNFPIMPSLILTSLHSIASWKRSGFPDAGFLVGLSFLASLLLIFFASLSFLASLNFLLNFVSSSFFASLHL